MSGSEEAGVAPVMDKQGSLVATLRLPAAILALPLLYAAYVIASKIWGENDAGAVNYVVLASLPGVPGTLLMLFALLGWRRRSAPPTSPFAGSPGPSVIVDRC